MYFNWNTSSNCVSNHSGFLSGIFVTLYDILMLQSNPTISYLSNREAKDNIDRIISNEGNGPPRGAPNFNAPTGAGGSMFEMMVPGHKVGLIIGKAGETIKQLQEQSGAKIVIIQVIFSRLSYFDLQHA